MSVNAATTVATPELTTEQVQRILVQPLEAVSVFLAAGPRVFDTNGSQVRIPKMAGPIVAGMACGTWRVQTTQICYLCCALRAPGLGRVADPAGRTGGHRGDPPAPPGQGEPADAAEPAGGRRGSR